MTANCAAREESTLPVAWRLERAGEATEFAAARAKLKPSEVAIVVEHCLELQGCKKTAMQGQDPAGSEPPGRRGTTQSSAVRGVLQNFFEQQLRLDQRRQEMMERHARERLVSEDQWRQAMQRIERERLVLEQEGMEREEQRRVREDARAERREAILTNLLTRLLQGDL